jgi:predicted permease
MNVDFSIIGALLPVFAVIVSGYGLRRFGFPGESFWPHAERLTYFILFPCLLVQRTATATLDLHTFAQMAAALSIAVLIMSGLLFIVLPWWPSGKATFTSFFQGSIRFNTYVGLSAAFALFGKEGLTAAVLTIAVLIPLLNILCVSILISLCGSEKRSWQVAASEVMRNPLVLACAAGTLLNISGTGLNPSINDILIIFGRAALPIGLLSVGAGLSFTAARKSGMVVAPVCLLKLIVFPLIMWGVCKTLNLDTMAASAAVLIAALPGSPAAYILARQLGGDSQLMASIITVQTPLSMMTIPVVMAFLVN